MVDENSVAQLSKAIFALNFVVLDALWRKGVLSYEDVLASIELVRGLDKDGVAGEITAQHLRSMERLARDGIRYRDTGAAGAWRPRLVEDPPAQP